MLDGLFPIHEQKIEAEEWRQVVGYEGRYEVSSLGRVRSVDRSETGKGRWGQRTIRYRGRVLTPIRQVIDGYVMLRVGLCNGSGRAKIRIVSNLVAEAFIGPRPAGLEVAHGDGSSENNAAGNLRYATPTENADDKAAHGTALRGSRIGNSRLSEDDVLSIMRRLGRGEKAVNIASHLGVSQSLVSQIRSGKRWGHLNAAI